MGGKCRRRSEGDMLVLAPKAVTQEVVLVADVKIVLAPEEVIVLVVVRILIRRVPGLSQEKG